MLCEVVKVDELDTVKLSVIDIGTGSTPPPTLIVIPSVIDVVRLTEFVLVLEIELEKLAVCSEGFGP